MDFLRRLRQQASGVQLIISDGGGEGLINEVFTAGWQRCRYIFLRNLLGVWVSLVGTLVRRIFVNPTRPAMRQVADQLRFPKAAADGSGRGLRCWP